jgi:hypothetical protein
MWFLIGVLVGASIRIAPSTEPCSLADVAAANPSMPWWAWIPILGAAALLTALWAIAAWQYVFADARAQMKAAKRAMLHAQAQLRQAP